MAGKKLTAGDKVSWESSGGRSTGRVVEKITATAKVKGHVAKATPEDPQYRVKSDKSGAEAIHRPESLDKS